MAAVAVGLVAAAVVGLVAAAVVGLVAAAVVGLVGSVAVKLMAAVGLVSMTARNKGGAMRLMYSLANVALHSIYPGIRSRWFSRRYQQSGII